MGQFFSLKNSKFFSGLKKLPHSVIHYYESLEGPLLKKENIFYLVITRKLTRNNEITNSL